jgi:hypothetical protein
MIKKILVSAVILIMTGCSQKNCKETYSGRVFDVCMQEGWKIGQEPFALFAIDKDQLHVKITSQEDSSEPPYVVKDFWNTWMGVIIGFNKPCAMLGDDKAITIDGKDAWIGTVHMSANSDRGEFYETMALVIYNNHIYMVDSRCNAPDKAKNIALVEFLPAYPFFTDYSFMSI